MPAPNLAATIAAAVLATLTTSTLHAQTYPAKTIRFVIPFPPGGSNDIVGRVLAASLTERLSRQVVADNRAGGNSMSARRTRLARRRRNGQVGEARENSRYQRGVTA